MRRIRGEGTIYQRQDGLWSGQVTLGVDLEGKRHRKTVYGRTRKETQEKLSLLVTQKQQGVLIDAGQETVEQFVSSWLLSIKHSLRPKTWDRYNLTAKKELYPAIGLLKIGDLTPFSVVQFYRKLTEANRSLDSQLKAGKLLRQGLRYAVKIGALHTSPADKVPLPKPVRKEIHPLTPEQIGRFLEAARTDRLFVLYLTALDTGARFGELAALEWRDIDFQTGEIVIQRSLSEVRGRFTTSETKTRAGRRRIRISDPTLAALEAHHEAQRLLNTALVFSDKGGGFLRASNVLRQSFKPILKRAGLPDIRFHDLRHTTATLLLLNGVNVKAVSERLGHAGVEITLSTYAHVLPAMQEQAVSVMDGLLGDKQQKCSSVAGERLATVPLLPSPDGAYGLRPEGFEPPTLGSEDLKGSKSAT